MGPVAGTTWNGMVKRSAGKPGRIWQVRGYCMFTRGIGLALLLLVVASEGAETTTRAAEGAENSEQILHALNRLTYGPRPGDVERVKAMGLQKWIESQLAPARIDD